MRDVSVRIVCDGEAVALEIEARSRGWYELADSSSRKFFVLIDESNAPAAFVQLLLLNVDNDPDLADGATVAHIHDLRVRQDFQRKGYGKQLMGFVELEAARVYKIEKLTLGVDNWNKAAVSFYENLNYSPLKVAPGRTPEEICIYPQKVISNAAE
jgi:ribosomal protein S18 acetylase RimI-like enzyme